MSTPLTDITTDVPLVLKAGPVTAPTLRLQFLFLVRESRLLQWAVLWIGLSIALALVGYRLAPYDPTEATANSDQPPSWAHLFGTDSSGFDVFSRTITSPQVDIGVAVSATLLGLIGGSLVGIVASYSRGWLGAAIMSVSDTIQSIPSFVVIMVVVVLLGPRFTNIVLVVAMVEVPLYVRLMRSQVLSIRERAFAETARASGNRPWRIAVWHVLPNALAPVLAQASITFGVAILITAGLSFIGAGVRQPTPEWGQMIAVGSPEILIGNWWQAIFPGIAMVSTVFAFAVLGEAVQTIALRRR